MRYKIWVENNAKREIGTTGDDFVGATGRSPLLPTPSPYVYHSRQTSINPGCPR
uniref:Uncharacterized protein n=1 Tax=Candidatus Kentrum sp. LPFa TaxID=2126335 RepID=A0A450X3C2_9GAMM|nr:MAG: hypothetical protein BECKLPF1236B_GA0070989_13784 [Candidatus Kentron sp. LPFa]